MKKRQLETIENEQDRQIGQRRNKDKERKRKGKREGG